MLASYYQALARQLVLLCALVSIAKTEIKLTLDLKPGALAQQVNVTTDYQVTCSAIERTYRYSRYGQGKSKILTRLRIQFQVERSLWQPLAQISNMEPDRVYVDPGIPHSEAEGFISSNLLEKSSSLTVKWRGPTIDAVNNFRCDATTFYHDYTNSGEFHWVDARIKTDKFDSFGFSLLSALEKETVMKDIDESQTKTKLDEINMKTMLDKVEVEETLKQFKLRLAQAKEYQTAKMKNTTKYLSELLNQVQANKAKMAADMESTLNSVIEGSFLMLWPRGTYALPKPATGCPITAGVPWQTGERRHHTESLARNKDEVSPGNHLQQPVLSRVQDTNFMYQRFCSKPDGESFGPSWPAGSYCINQQDFKCPEGFYRGQIRWQEENFRSDATISGVMPSGEFEQHKTKLFYCCRSDGSADEPVDLPRFQPFYLYRYGGQCQQVGGMRVTEEFMRFDTENYYNGDEAKGSHPDAEVRDIVLHLCYYERSSTFGQ